MMDVFEKQVKIFNRSSGHAHFDCMRFLHVLEGYANGAVKLWPYFVIFECMSLEESVIWGKYLRKVYELPNRLGLIENVTGFYFVFFSYLKIYVFFC